MGIEASKPEVAIQEAARQEAVVQEAARQEAAKRETTKLETAKKETTKLEFEAKVLKELNDVKAISPGDFLSAEEIINIYEKCKVLVIGLHHAGKSTFINNIYRVVLQEWDKPFTAYATSAPAAYGQITIEPEKFQIKGLPRICFYDTQAVIQEQEKMDYKSLISLKLKDTVDEINVCILVIDSKTLEGIGTIEQLKELAKSIVQLNRRPIVVLTNKLDKTMPITQIRAFCGTDYVFEIDNYTMPDNILTIPTRNLDSDLTIIRILKACFLTADRFHSQKLLNKNTVK